MQFEDDKKELQVGMKLNGKTQSNKNIWKEVGKKSAVDMVKGESSKSCRDFILEAIQKCKEVTNETPKKVWFVSQVGELFDSCMGEIKEGVPQESDFHVQNQQVGEIQNSGEDWIGMDGKAAGY